MPLRRRIPLAVSALALGLTLSGCESLGALDPSEWFSNKKPLPGERRAVFPEGVPGVPQGVPPELVQGYEPPPEPPPAVAEEPKPKPKPRPRVAAPVRQAPAPRSAPTAVTVQPQPQQPGGQAPWPSSQQTASQPAPSQTQFPDPPRR